MQINDLQLTPLKYIAAHNDIRQGPDVPKPIVSRRKSEIFVMTSARTMTSSHDTDGALRRGLSRFVGEFAAGFEAIFEIFAKAGDGSAAARARFPSAD